MYLLSDWLLRHVRYLIYWDSLSTNKRGVKREARSIDVFTATGEDRNARWPRNWRRKSALKTASQCDKDALCRIYSYLFLANRPTLPPEIRRRVYLSRRFSLLFSSDYYRISNARLINPTNTSDSLAIQASRLWEMPIRRVATSTANIPKKEEIAP